MIKIYFMKKLFSIKRKKIIPHGNAHEAATIWKSLRAVTSALTSGKRVVKIPFSPRGSVNRSI